MGLAVSGGADSVALLRLLLGLRRELGAVLAVVHFNHQLRGAESDADERFVADLAGRHSLELHAGSGEVATYAAEKHLSVETAAREMRYTYFRACCENRASTGLLPRILSTIRRKPSCCDWCEGPGRAGWRESIRSCPCRCLGRREKSTSHSGIRGQARSFDHPAAARDSAERCRGLSQGDRAGLAGRREQSRPAAWAKSGAAWHFAPPRAPFEPRGSGGAGRNG